MILYVVETAYAPWPMLQYLRGPRSIAHRIPLHTLLVFPVPQSGLPDRRSPCLLSSVSCERATTTGQRAWRTIESETLPINALPITLLPRVPTTIRSTFNSSAKPTTSCATPPILRCAPATVPPAILIVLSSSQSLSSPARSAFSCSSHSRYRTLIGAEIRYLGNRST